MPEYRGTFDYPGYCLGMSPIQIPLVDIEDIIGAVDDNRKPVVIELAKAIQKEYKKQASYPSLCAIQNELVESMLALPPPAPWSGPAFSGDGRGSTYLRHKYPLCGPTAIELSDFFIGLNKTDPGPFFRITEWRGRIMLSADFNECAVDPKVVDGWMNSWASSLLSIAM